MADANPVSISMTPELQQRLDKAAEEDGRSRSGMARMLLIEALSARGVTLNDPGHGDDSQTGRSVADAPILDVSKP